MIFYFFRNFEYDESQFDYYVLDRIQKETKNEEEEKMNNNDFQNIVFLNSNVINQNYLKNDLIQEDKDEINKSEDGILCKLFFIFLQNNFNFV